MSSTFFTTEDGDVILRTGTGLGPKHEFRVHTLILSLASPVFKDMFTFPQPPNQNQTEQPDIPVVDVPDSPEVLDAILRFIYPGVESPEFQNLSLLPVLLSAADKYNIASMSLTLREALTKFLPGDSFSVYAIACRFGFLEEAREAAMVSTSKSMLNGGSGTEVSCMANADIFRFVRFFTSREEAGRSAIRELLEVSSSGFGLSGLGDDTDKHWEEARVFYLYLAKAVEDEFVRNPRLELQDLVAVLDRILDPPLGCKPNPRTAEFYRDDGEDYAFSCPLQPMFIRRILADLVAKLNEANRRVLEDIFGAGTVLG